MNATVLRFNFGFLLEATLGTSRTNELDIPSVQLDEEITLAPLQGSFIATRISEGVYISGKLTSGVQMECMRCLGEMVQSLTIKLEELYFYPSNTAPEEDSQVFDGETGNIDLSPLVRELTVLELPIRPICREDCHGLCMVCGQNLNEADCGCVEDDIDPRMAKLKSLLE